MRQQLATITQRDNGGWQAAVRRKGHPAAYGTFAKKSDAEIWAAEIEREIRMGIYMPRKEAESTTFSDLAKAFEADFAPHHYRGKAWKYKLAALKERLGKYALAALTPAIVAKYRDDRLTDPDPRYKLNRDKAPRISPSTVKTEIDLLSKVLDVAQKEFSIALPAGNPVLAVRKPKAGKGRDRRLTAVEWEAMMRECMASGNLWLAPAVTIAVETSMRQGEMLSMEWQHFDRKRRLVLLLDPDLIKTAEPRAVPLSSAAMTAIDSLPRALSGRMIPINRMTLYKAFERACERARIEDYTWHDLRHEALSRLAERGDFTVIELAAVSGHKTLQMLKRYTHLQATKLAEKMG